MFDPNKVYVPQVRRLPVILLLDVSGSMSGDKIDMLYDATVDMVNSFVDQAVKEVEINVAIFTFGSEVRLHTPYTAVKDLKAKGINRFNASGNTPLGAVLQMSKNYIEDKNYTLGSDYAPAVVLVSDGAPNDHWQGPLRDFITDGRSAKAQRLAVPIGADADRRMLEQFTGDPSLVFYAEKATDIADSFNKVSMSVSKRSRSMNPDAVPTNRGAYDNKSRSVSVKRASVASKKRVDDDDDDLLGL